MSNTSDYSDLSSFGTRRMNLIILPVMSNTLVVYINRIMLILLVTKLSRDLVYSFSTNKRLWTRRNRLDYGKRARQLNGRGHSHCHVHAHFCHWSTCQYPRSDRHRLWQCHAQEIGHNLHLSTRAGWCDYVGIFAISHSLYKNPGLAIRSHLLSLD